MATVVDSLVIEFGLDPKNFTAGQKQVVSDIETVEKQADKTGRKMEESGKRAANFYSEITKELIGLIGAFAGANAVGAFAAQTTQADAALGRTAQTLDMSADKLSKWEGAARRAGAAGGSITSAFQNISQQIQRFQLGESSALVARAAQLGVTLSDGNGKPLSPDEIFEGFAEKMKGMDPARALAISREIGMPDDTLQMLLKGRGGIESTLAEQDKIGHTTQKDVDAAKALNSDMVALDEATHRVGEQLLTLFSPALDRAIQALTGWAEKLETWITNHPDEAKAATGAAVIGGTVLGGSLISRLWSRLFGGGGGGGGSVAAEAEAAGGGFASSFLGKALGAGALAWLSRNYLMSPPNQEGWDKFKKDHPDLDKTPEWSETVVGKLWNRLYNSGKTLGVRNNNPGNLRFAGQEGATEGEGGFAKFDTMERGTLALDRQLKLYQARGLNTIRKIISTYAPKGDNNNTAAYIDAVAKALGISADDLLNGSDDQNKKFERAIFDQENGKVWGERLSPFLDAIRPRPTPGAETGPTSSNHSEVHIGKVDVHTQAVDADGIARDFSGAVQDYVSAAQANAGLA